MKNNKTVLYIIIAYVWSFGFWILGFSTMRNSSYEIVFNAELVQLLLNKQLVPEMVIGTILTTLAVYGPFVAMLIVKTLSKTENNVDQKRLATNWNTNFQAVGLIIVITLAPGLLMIGQYSSEINLNRLVVLLICFFAFQLMTSGTEEFGWRGLLQPELMKNNTLWQACLKVGFIWGFWHTPVVLYMFINQGMSIPQIVSSFIGFIAGIIGMSFLQGYFYYKSKSKLLAVFLHALSNTLPLFIGLLSNNGYIVSIASQVTLWIAVIVLTKVKKEEFHCQEY